MTHEVKPLKITLTRFLLCSILSGFFFFVATICFYAFAQCNGCGRYIQVQLHTPTEAYLDWNECIGLWETFCRSCFGWRSTQVDEKQRDQRVPLFIAVNVRQKSPSDAADFGWKLSLSWWTLCSVMMPRFYNMLLFTWLESSKHLPRLQRKWTHFASID